MKMQELIQSETIFIKESSLIILQLTDQSNARLTLVILICNRTGNALKLLAGEMTCE